MYFFYRSAPLRFECVQVLLCSPRFLHNALPATFHIFPPLFQRNNFAHQVSDDLLYHVHYVTHNSKTVLAQIVL